MNLLAVDSSTAKATVALYQDGRITEKQEILDGKTHSETLAPMIHQVLEQAGIQPEQVDIYAAAIGPGSFTGLRIGVSTIKAMAMAVEKPCVGVPTLDALAYNGREEDGILCPLLDARNDQVYAALYETAPWGTEGSTANGAAPRRLTEDMAKSVAEVLEDLRQAARGKQVFLLGDGAQRHGAFLAAGLEGIARVCRPVSPERLLADSASVAFVAAEMAKKGMVTDCDALVPRYLRKSSAERLREARAEQER